MRPAPARAGSKTSTIFCRMTGSRFNEAGPREGRKQSIEFRMLITHRSRFNEAGPREGRKPLKFVKRYKIGVKLQ